MRNKEMHASPFRWMLKRYFFLLIITFLLTFAVFPMQGMSRVLSTARYLSEMEEPMSAGTRTYLTGELTMKFVYSPLNLEMICLLFGGLGFAAAMVLFRHLFSRRQALMIAGLPMKRSTLFRLRFQTYGLLCLLPMGICLAIYPAAVWANGMWDLFSLSTYALRAGMTLLINLYGFTLGVLCASVFGTAWAAALGGITLAFSAEAALFCWFSIAGGYLSTLYVSGAVRRMILFSPAYTLYKGFYQPGLVSPLPGILAILLFAVLAWLAYGKALPENAGQTLNRKKLEPVILAWATVLGGTAGGMILTLYMSQEVILYAGILLGAAAAWALVRILLDQRIRISMLRWQIPAAAAVLMVCVLLGMRSGWFGFNGYSPSADSLETISVCPGITGPEVMRFSDEEGLQACLKWVGQMRSEALEDRQKEPFQPAYYTDVRVDFREKSGRTVTRVYRYPKDQAAVLSGLKVMAEKYGQQQSREISSLSRVSAYSAIPLFGVSNEEFRELYGFSTELGKLDADQVREALREDLKNRTLAGRQEPTLLNISFSGTDPETGEYLYDGFSYQIKPEDRHTLELILGEDAEKWISYARGGFAKAGDIKVFLCEYAQDGKELWTLKNYRMAESEEEVREWVGRTVQCNETFFEWPADPAWRLQVYSISRLREMMQYRDDPGPELDDPEVIARLPEMEDFYGNTYLFRMEDAD